MGSDKLSPRISRDIFRVSFRTVSVPIPSKYQVQRTRDPLFECYLSFVVVGAGELA